MMASEESWQAGHRAARPYLHATAGALGLAALCAIFAPTTLANIALLGGMAIGIASLAVAGQEVVDAGGGVTLIVRPSRLSRCCPHWPSGCSASLREVPSLVREYSTLGGTSA